MAWGYGHVTSGYWAAVVIGVVELLILIMYAITRVRRERRLRRDAGALVSVIQPSGGPPFPADGPPSRCWGLIAEAMIAHERVSGQIDAATYQARMGDLVSRS